MGTAAVTGITLNQFNAIVEQNKILYLWYTIFPTDAYNTRVVWSSSNVNVARVDDNGIVYTNDTLGVTTITATTQDGGFTSTCLVTVQANVVNVSTIEIIVPDITIYHYDYVQLSAIILPDEATDKVVYWKSSNESIATIDSSGKMYANYFGTVTITAITEDSQCSTQVVTAVDEDGLIAVDENGLILSDVIKVALTTSVTITILPVPVRSISFEESSYAVPVTHTAEVTVVFNPSNADNQNLSFYTSDVETVVVSEHSTSKDIGTITGVSGGSASISAISEDGNHTASCVIKVLGNYVPNIINFDLKSISRVDSGIQYTFTFDHDMLFFGGYELYYTYTRSGFILAKFFVDTNILQVSNRDDTANFITVDNNKCTISYILPAASIIDGHEINFRLRRMSVNHRDKSSYTKFITTYTYPSTPNTYIDNLSMLIENENNKMVIRFNNIVKADSNSAVTRTVITKNIMTEIKILSMTDLVIESSDILKGDVVTIIDYKHQSIWCGTAVDDNYIDISNILLNLYSHTYTAAKPPYVHNLKLFKESSIEIDVSTITDLTDNAYIIQDPQVAVNNIILYKVTFFTPDDSIYSRIFCPIAGRHLSSTSIYWRPLEASATAVLKNLGWKNMRDVLIDRNYYNKTMWDLPYSKKDCYDIVGFVGIANCYVDIYLNDIFYRTIETDSYGNFHVKYYFPIGETSLYTIARTKDNSEVSSQSSTIIIRTQYVYSWFAAIAAQHAQVVQQNALARKQLNIDTADEPVVKNLYGQLAGLAIHGNEPISDFTRYVKAALSIYNNIGKQQAISDLITLFKSMIDSIDDIKYISNAAFEDAYIPNYSLITSPRVDAPLPRAKYKYTVTACTNDQQETDGTNIIVDMRYSAQSDQSQSNAVLSWTPVVGADYYKVYRGVYSSSNIFLGNSLLTIDGIDSTLFVDNGMLATTALVPPLYNVSELSNIDSIKHLNYYYLNSWKNLLKKPNYFNIIISMIGNSTIPDYLLIRFNQMLRTVVLADQFYRIIVFNDTSISAYDTSVALINSISDLDVVNS